MGKRLKMPFAPGEMSKLLLAWYNEHGRDLPWRRTRDPYRIWLSEIMLQQTTVVAVIPYYNRFLARFPDVTTLAAADPEAVLELWSGLGYYSRARNLHRAAQQIAAEMGGCFPDTVEALQKLPGIGRSTAGAIVSIAYGRPAPILDGNVRRVLSRLMALDDPPREKEAEKSLWSWAEALTPESRPHDYAQAIMDLGATLCLPRQPLCPECPLALMCQAHQTGRENELPRKGSKKKVAMRRQVILMLRRGPNLLVRRRPPAGLLGGMWEFPCREIVVEGGREDELRALLVELELRADPEWLGTIQHVYSHFRLQADVYLADLPTESKIAEGEMFWHDADKLVGSPLHGAHQKALRLHKKEDAR